MDTAYPPSVPSQQAYRPMTIGDWIVTQLLIAIPLVGLIMLFVWAFSSDTQPSKKTYCQATLIFLGCIVALVVVLGVVGLVGASAHPRGTINP